MLSCFALSRRVLAQLRRAKGGVYIVEHALSACSTIYTPLSEHRRREQAIVMEIRHTLTLEEGLGEEQSLFQIIPQKICGAPRNHTRGTPCQMLMSVGSCQQAGRVNFHCRAYRR